MWREDLKKGMTPFQFLLFCSRPYRWWALGAFLAVIITIVLETSVSYTFKMIVTAATAPGESLLTLWESTFLYLVVFSLELLMWRVSSLLATTWSTSIRATGQYSLTAYVTHHGTQYFSDRFAGSVSNKIATAAHRIRDIGSTFLWDFTTIFVALCTSVLFIFPTSHTLAYILISWVIFIIPLNIYFSRHRAYLASIVSRAQTILSGTTVDSLTNMSAVQDYANREFELSQFKKLIIDRRNKGIRASRYTDVVLFVNSLIQILFIGGLLITAIYYFQSGEISAGDIVLILSLVVVIRGKLSDIGSTLSDFAEHWGDLKESLDDILIDQDITNKEGARPLSTHSNSVTFNNATFKYGETTVFDNLSLTIPQGQKVGLVGRSGAGKSTLVKLLLRHYDLTDGSIRIGEENIAEVTKDSLRRAIAIVPQEPLLFHRSIRDNIAYGKPGATEEEIVKAATLAEAHEFIEKVSGGYNALVGERGVKLSGGQRQRIVIARAILKDAPILLLDEATSALDSESEGAVQKALFTLMEHRTVIAVAHRLSTLRAMDRIIVMDEGTIIEDGTHEELLAKEGVYAMLWNHQAGGFIEE